jgi:hypothetical protein
VSLRSAIIAGGIFTVFMLLFLAALGSAFQPLEILLWAAVVILGWLWILSRARPKGTR